MSIESVGRFEVNHAAQTRPKYAWVKQYLHSELEAGRLKPGQALPSETQLADNLQISRSTVRQAFAELEQEGIIHRVHGKGTYIREINDRCQSKNLAAFALVIPESQGGFYPSLLRGFETAAKQFHHQVIVSTTNNELKQQESILLQLLDKKVAGVAMVPTTTPPTPPYQVRRLQEAGIPVVFCHRSVKGVAAPLLALPFHKLGRMAGNAFVKFEHKRVAYFANHRSSSTEAYAAGLQEALREGGGDLMSEFTYYCPVTDASITDLAHESEQDVVNALDKMLCHSDPPTGIMTNFDPLAELIYMKLISMGLRVPEDMSVVGVGGTRREGVIVRRLSSVTVNESQVGGVAAELLYEMSAGQRALGDTERILIQPGFTDGQTLGKARQCDEALVTSKSHLIPGMN